jgi:hypothetical protein
MSRFYRLLYTIWEPIMLKAVVDDNDAFYYKNSDMERVSKSVQMLLPVKINT